MPTNWRNKPSRSSSLSIQYNYQTVSTPLTSWTLKTEGLVTSSSKRSRILKVMDPLLLLRTISRHRLQNTGLLCLFLQPLYEERCFSHGKGWNTRGFVPLLYLLSFLFCMEVEKKFGFLFATAACSLHVAYCLPIWWEMSRCALSSLPIYILYLKTDHNLP